MDAETIHDEVQDLREDVVALCADLVAAHSVNPEGDTRAAAAVVAAALRERGLASSTVSKVASMPSVVAELDSGRPGPHLVLNVHLDTMPAGDETAWTVDPWTLTRRDGRLYGLGMGNMKGAVAAAVVAMGLLAGRREEWTGRVTLAAVSDEVVFGDNGAAHLLATMPDLLGDAVICGEGAGYYRLALGEKGVLWLELTATGRPGHSSAVRAGESASARIAAAVGLLDELTGRTSTRPPELADVTVRPGDTSLQLTANVGLLTAGSFVGQIATTARAEVDLRVPPGMTIDAVEAEVRALVGVIPTVTVRRMKGWDANWTGSDAELTTAWMRAAALVGGPHPTSPATELTSGGVDGRGGVGAHVRGDAEVELAVRLPASDASRWRRRGVPALCFGPQPTFSAGIDDYAEEDEVLRCVELYTHTALAYLGTGA